MECYLKKDKIREGIVNAIKDMVTQSTQFEIDGNRIISKQKIEEPTPLTDEQLESVDKKFAEHVNKIDKTYVTAAKENPIDFLYNIAAQAHADVEQQVSAMEIAGTSLYELATQLFPNAGIDSPEAKFIKEINAKFKDTVLTQHSANVWTITPSDDLVMFYLMSQTGSKDALIKEIRNKYLSQFSSVSLNMAEGNLWINHPMLQDPDTQKLITFMKAINPNAKIGIVENLDKKAVALIRDYIILIRTGSIIDELPHEVAHFFIELLPDEHPLKIEMMKNIINLPIYGEIYNQYKNNPLYQKDGKPDIDKIKREAIAQQIGNFVKAAFRDEADKKYGKHKNWIESIFDKLIAFIRRMFAKHSPPMYTEPLIDLNSPFRHAATSIINANIADLNIKKIPSLYDSIFFSEVADNTTKVYGADELVKRLHTFSTALRNQLLKSFWKLINDNNLKGVKEMLADVDNKDYNKVFDIYTQLSYISTKLWELRGEKNPSDIEILTATSRLANTYNEMIMIPDAIKKTLDNMEIGNTEEKFINNIYELQSFFTFTDTFKKISEEFQELLDFVSISYPDNNQGDMGLGQQIYEQMSKRMSNIDSRMTTEKNRVLSKLKIHVKKLMEVWTMDYLPAHRDQLMARYKTSSTPKIKELFLRELYEKFTSPEQFEQALTGDIPEFVTSHEGRKGRFQDTPVSGFKADVSRIADVTDRDYLKWLFTSPTLITDPFVSNVMAHFNDRYMEFSQKGDMETRQYLNKISPLMNDLKSIGVDWYAINRSLHNIQDFFDPTLTDNKTQKRVLLSSTDRFNAHFHLQMLYKAEDDIRTNIFRLSNNLRSKLNENASAEDIADLEKQIEELTAQREQMIKDRQKWEETYMNRPFTKEFYDRRKLLDPRPEDSSVLKEIKELTKEIIQFQEAAFSAVIMDSVQGANSVMEVDSAPYIAIIKELAQLENRRGILKDKLPTTEKETFEKINELYEEDTIASSRLQQAHKNRWVAEMTRVVFDSTSEGEDSTGFSNIKTGKYYQQLHKDISDRYDALYTIVEPTQEFYDKRAELFNRLTDILGRDIIFKGIQERIDNLREAEKNILNKYRDFRKEVNISSLRFIYATKIDDKGNQVVLKDIDGKPITLAWQLAAIETEIDMLRRKANVFSSYTNSQRSEEGKLYAIGTFNFITALNQIAKNHLKYTPKKVVEIFSDQFDLSEAEGKLILEAITQSIHENNAAYSNLQSSVRWISKLDLSGNVAKQFNFVNVEESIKGEDALYQAAAQELRGVDDFSKGEIDSIFEEMKEMYGDAITLQYSIAMRPFFAKYAPDYAKSNFPSDNKDAHVRVIKGELPQTIADIEAYMKKGLFDSVIEYMLWRATDNTISEEEGKEIQELADFYLAIHKEKSLFVDGQFDSLTVTPLSFIKRPEILNPTLYKEKAPNFLTKNRVRDSLTDKYGKLIPLRTEKIDELGFNHTTLQQDPDAANKPVTVDINGHWLPLATPTIVEDGVVKPNPYWNKDYDDLKNGTTTEQKKKFELLQEITKLYLERQAAGLSVGERLDLVVPTRHMDAFEEKLLYLQYPKELWEWVKKSLPVKVGTQTEDDEEVLQELKAITPRNTDLYTGLNIHEHSAKLKSQRRMRVERTTEDIVSSIAMFYEDINEFTGKNLVGPIMKSFADVFTSVSEKYAWTNKRRAEIFTLLHSIKILGEVPKSFQNTKFISTVVGILNKFASMRLLGDPLGSLVNITSGAVQGLIEVQFSKSAALNFTSASAKAARWLYEYDADFYHRGKFGLETQLIGVFSMIPDRMDISEHMSIKALYANIHRKLMAPRTEGEKYLAIQTALAVISTEPIVHNGQVITFDTLYELNTDTGIIQLKSEFSHLEKEWNPLNGTTVIKLRRKLTQFYLLQQGNYYPQNSAYASQFTLGRMVLLMKQWFAPLFIRGFEGRTTDPMMKGERIGHRFALYSLIREFFQSMISWDANEKKIKTGDWDRLNDYWTNVATHPAEQAAIRRALAEMMYVAIFGLMVLMMGYNSDDKDKNKRIKEMSYLKQLMLLLVMRVEGEIGTQIPLPILGLGYMEMKRAVLDPIGLPKMAADNLMGFGKLFTLQLLSWMGVGGLDSQLYFQVRKGYDYHAWGLGAFKDKGDSKLWALILNTIGYTGYTFEPAQYIKTFTQMQNRIR